MHHRFKTKLFAWVTGTLCSGLISSLCLAADPAFDQARALLQNGKANEAYSQLAPLEYEHAGELEYDYLLGLAALDSGKPDKATLAFERVLAVNPNHAGARLDMARAYYALGNNVQAKTELEAALSQNPPPAARATIHKYLAAIEESGRSKTEFTGYLATGFGHDNNITGVTTDFAPAALATYGIAYLPTGNALTYSSPFLSLEGGGEIKAPFSKNLYGFAGVDAKFRSYTARHNYDTDTLDAHVGVNLTDGNHSYRLSLVGQTYNQEGEAPTSPKQTSDRNMLGVNAEWHNTLNVSTQVGVFLQINEQRYPTTNTSNVVEKLLGVSLLHAYTSARKPLVFMSIFYGQDKAMNLLANGSDVSKSFTGVRLGGQCSPNEKTDIFASLGYQWRNDSSAFARSTIIDYGKDHLADLTMGINRRLDQNWSVQPQLTFVRNQGNIPTAEFDRTQISVMFRRSFR
jgi:tetratricopeptide (TPR) repeat protein